MSRALPGAVAGALLLAAAPAAAHEVLHAVERGGRAVALHAYFADGEPLAYCEYQIFSPGDPRIPYQKGRTDRNGWVAFVPDVAGRWRVRIVDATGHGLDVQVDADAVPAVGSAAPEAPGQTTAAFVLRPLVAIAGIAAVFGALLLAYRRKGTRP